ncbi:MAG: anthrone oxygenase family protein [Verrucomicrobiota bacterium]
MNDLLTITAVLGAIGSGIMCGLFFAFSNFVMAALAELPNSKGGDAMRLINRRIINPAFFVLFFGSAVISLLAVSLSIWNWDSPRSRWVLVGGLCYLIGCMFVTMFRNVPLNNRLDPVDDQPMDWQTYVRRWLPWNHVRTVGTLASTAAFALGLIGIS